MDGVFDLFHRGHLEAIKKVRKEAGVDGTVVIGIVMTRMRIHIKDGLCL